VRLSRRPSLYPQGIRETLAEELGLHDVEEAADGLAAYDLLVSKAFDIAIIDISMPGKAGSTSSRT